MPKASVLQSSFSTGEVSPLYYGQAENPRYKKGLEKALNMLPLLQGPAVRRPGTKFCALTKSTSAAPILIPFQFSETQAYMLEFGNQYIRFFANNGQLVTTGLTYLLKGQTNTSTIYNDPARGVLGYFYATRASAALQQNEFIITTQSTVAAANILELASPYLTADLPLLRWIQSADTIYLIHPNYPIYKLQRQAQTYWRLFPVSLQDGPYFPLNTYSILGDCSNFTVGTGPFVPAPANTIEIRAGGAGVAIAGAVTDPGGSGQIQITTGASHGMFTGQNVFISGVTGTTEANNWDFAALPGAAKAYWPIQVTSATTFLLIGSTFVNAYAAGGTMFPALFAQSADAFRLTLLGFPTLIPDSGRVMGLIIGGVRYFTYLSTPINAALFGSVATAPIPGNVLATAWQLGVYSPGLGFPRCGTFHQNRLCLGGPGGAPQEFDASVTGQYENFAPSNPTNLQVTDHNALSFQLTSSDSNVLQWMASTAQGVAAGTYVAEWSITPASTSDALTPTNFNAQQTSFFGGAPTAPVQLGNSTFYIQRAFRKIREMTFYFAAGTFRSIDMTELSEHLTVPKILHLAVTKETQPIIWAVRSDGALISMIFNRDDLTLIAGWTPHKLGGQSDAAGNPPIVSSIASIPAPDLSFDQLWMVVQRYVNGTSKFYIEYMTKIFDDSILQEDAFQLDCGATFYNPVAITSISVANPCVVTLGAPVPFVVGDRVRIQDVVGLDKTTTDINGNVTISNLVNHHDFIVAGIVGNTFQLHDFSGNPVSSVGYSAYLSGGSVSKLVTTISGLTWLIGETLFILADGGIAGQATVYGGGQIDLPFEAAKVQLGYNFKSQMKLLRADAGSPDGSSIGKTRRTTRLAVQMHRTGDLALGTSFQNLIPVQFMQADVDQADQPMPLFSGMIREGIESAYDFESQCCLEMSSALPGCVQSVTAFMEEVDV